MAMRMVHVRHVRMRVPHRFVFVRMRVRLAGRIRRLMVVSVVDVMHMRMRMNNSLVHMLVFVMFSQVQPYANCH